MDVLEHSERSGRGLTLPSKALASTVRCSAGTYIRTLGESIAERLGTVGHLTRLVRLRIGAWRLEDAKPLAWIDQVRAEIVARELRPVLADYRPSVRAAQSLVCGS